ncbi:hypothetical protein KIN20_010884 [Parelaphostrongylus tenuis]|uniref:Uncharacterized protein n=1 Tax=Parelaphostrongylus tenuis TaxID=148309 RepID=A0AAD5QJ46_PARTN|nr:hypothetical protein KIN20_010884 [Parelaphostrongylus tenuis]
MAGCSSLIKSFDSIRNHYNTRSLQQGIGTTRNCYRRDLSQRGTVSSASAIKEIFTTMPVALEHLQFSTFLISLLIKFVVVLGCGVMPQGQGNRQKFRAQFYNFYYENFILAR